MKLTHEQIMQMDGSKPEHIEAMAEQMGYIRCTQCDTGEFYSENRKEPPFILKKTWNPFLNIADTWMVIQHMEKLGWYRQVQIYSSHNKQGFTYLTAFLDFKHDYPEEVQYESLSEEPKCTCQAALLALNKEE